MVRGRCKRRRGGIGRKEKSEGAGLEEVVEEEVRKEQEEEEKEDQNVSVPVIDTRLIEDCFDIPFFATVLVVMWAVQNKV
jgi:hypothetical protein